MHHVAQLLEFASENIKRYEELMNTDYTIANWKNSAGWFDSDIPTDSHDYDVCLQAIDASNLALSYIEKFEAANNGTSIPKKGTFVAKANEFKKKAIHLHPHLCIHKILTMAGNRGEEGRKVYWNALRRFPKARASAIQQSKEAEARVFERRPWDLKEGWYRAAQDPFDGQTIADAFEEEQDYHPAAEYAPVVPNDPSLGVRKQKSMKDSKLWTDLHKKWAGNIVFSNTPIDANSPVEGDIKSTFVGSDEIYGRAYWPNALAQIPVAKKKSDGSAVYLSKYLFNTGLHILEIGQFVTVDGVKQDREAQPEGVFTWFQESGVRGDEKSYEGRFGQETDFYAFNQSCRLFISRKDVADPTDEWQTSSNRHQLVLSRLPPGQHTVKIDLCYRLVSTQNNMDRFKKVFPPFTTAWSHPIATGEFTINTSSIPVAIGNIFPKRVTSLPAAVAKEYEGLILKFLTNSKGWGARNPQTEVPFHVAITGDWYPSGSAWFKIGNSLVEETTEYSIEFTALFYRDPSKGWAPRRGSRFPPLGHD
eukprot:TRINITY_DN2628_c0_g1_i1.p1 TRINITY_DN2628_c0_g1~~TRINITY_DN2628_c0_g1_i1.p1  ORF type:complete len:534 (-),score=104.51 TRINITY_DN2628_c0_g1_i1:239-1840(-)